MTRKQFASSTLGDYVLTSVYDGFALAPSAALVTSTDGPSLANEWHVFTQTRKVLTRADVLMFVVDTGDERILIDAGAGRMLGPTMGSGRKNLVAAGLNPLGITKILITHPHPDHVGGIVNGGAMAYPNARVYLDGSDYGYWTSPEHTYRQLGLALAPYESAGRITLFMPGDELAPGVRAVPLPGHTIGHTGFEVESAGQSALFWGDIIHDYDYQLAHPDRTLVLRDFDPRRVRDEVSMQQKVLKEVSARRRLVVAPHAPFPGVGYIRRIAGGKYCWEPSTK